MKTHDLGDSALSVTPMGLGLAALGRPGYINLGHDTDLGANHGISEMELRTHQVLDAAWETGIRYFDTARSYGRAEEFLGSWLRARGHADVTIGSKWGYTYTADWQIEAEKHEVKEHSLSVLDRQIQESREQLGDFLNLYQIHSATLESDVLVNEPVLNRLSELKAGGLRIGLSVSGPQQQDVIRKACEIQINSQRLFDTVQATWNLLEQSAGPALQEAAADGMGVIIKEGLANGRLTERNHEPAFADRLKTLQKISSEIGATVDQIALAAIINQPWTGVVLSGAATMEHLATNAGAVTTPWSEDISERLKDLTETPDQYWNTRSRLNWN